MEEHVGVARVCAPSSTAGVTPTLCEAMGARIPRGAQGRSLWPMLQGNSFPREEFRGVYAEVGFGRMHYDACDQISEKSGRIPGAPGALPSFDKLNPVTRSGNLKMVPMGDWKLAFNILRVEEPLRPSEGGTLVRALQEVGPPGLPAPVQPGARSAAMEVPYYCAKPAHA